MDLLKLINEHHLVEPFVNGNFGLEKEGLRAAIPATLSATDHPESLGNREVNPHIKTDYGEAQPEIITPPLSPYTKAHNWLHSLSYVLVSNLPENEYMWPFSVPCKMPENDEDIRISHTTNPELAEYRLYTASKYGKKRQLVNGIHINYSFDNVFLLRLFEIQDEFDTVEALRDELYLKFASNFLRYQWLLVYLFGATPLAEDNFFDGPFFVDKEKPTAPIRSLRNSQYGFTNNPKVIVRYDSIENYTGDLQNAVATGLLRKEREYYGSVRLRGIVKDSISLLENGIQYVEVRSFDNDPYHIAGITKETLQFIHLFFLTMVCLPGKAEAEETELGNNLTKFVASEHPYDKTVQYDEGVWLLDQMQSVVHTLGLDSSYSGLVAHAFECLDQPEKTIAGRIIQAIDAGISLLTLGEELGLSHKEEVLSLTNLPGFEHLSEAQQQQLINIFEMGLDIPTEYIEEIHKVE